MRNRMPDLDPYTNEESEQAMARLLAHLARPSGRLRAVVGREVVVVFARAVPQIVVAEEVKR